MASMVPQPQQPGSSGSDGDPRYAQFDERKRKRMISNRESARRSRMKKQQHLDGLLNEVSRLQNENGVIAQRANHLERIHGAVAAENDVLKAQVTELTDRLGSLNMVLEMMAVAYGIKLDIPEVPSTSSFEPWQLPFPTLPAASADILNF